MTRKIVTGALIAAVVGLAVALFVSPFLTAQAIVRAARAGDAAALERQVDFPAFRASLKSELNARAGLEIRDRAKGDRGLAALGMLLAVQIAAGVLAFVVMIVLSRHPLVVEVKRQFCRSEKMKMLLRAG